MPAVSSNWSSSPASVATLTSSSVLTNSSALASSIVGLFLPLTSITLLPYLICKQTFPLSLVKNHGRMRLGNSMRLISPVSLSHERCANEVERNGHHLFWQKSIGFARAACLPIYFGAIEQMEFAWDALKKQISVQ